MILLKLESFVQILCLTQNLYFMATYVYLRPFSLGKMFSETDPRCSWAHKWKRIKHIHANIHTTRVLIIMFSVCQKI